MSKKVKSKRAERPTVLLLGTGPAGTAAALQLLQAGLDVHMVEKSAQPGGLPADFSCKATTRCQRCNVCVAKDLTQNAFAREDSTEITLHTNSQLMGLEEIKTQPGPTFKATIEHSGQGKPTTLDVNAVLVCTGFTPYVPSDNNALQYGKLPNVITGLDLEKTHPSNHLLPLLRKSDGKEPRSIAFIQCVGSRNQEPSRGPEQTNFCSTICCAYALRLARLLNFLTSKNDQPTEITIFQMDIQRFGRDFETFYQECQREIRFVKARPYQLSPAENNCVTVRYENQPGCEPIEETFDMVVLSTGIRPNADNNKMAAKLDVPLNEFGFFDTIKTVEGATARLGIYAAGTATGPMDIARTIATAKAAAGSIIEAQA